MIFFIVSFFSFAVSADNSKGPSQLKKFVNTSSFADRNTKDQAPVEQLIHQMTEEEKIGQLLVVRTYSRKPIKEILQVFTPGGFIHSKSFEDKKDYKKALIKINKLKDASLKKTRFVSLYMLDQEGGVVNKLKPYSFGVKNSESSFFDIPGPLKLASINNLKLVEEFAFEIGQLLFALGFNMSLSPVVDVFNPQIKGFIRERSFSSDPYQVQKLSRAFASGLQRSGLIATFKHFPGYSNTNLDSHNTLVEIPSSKKELRARDWIPYQFKKGFSYPKAIMSNIAYYPQLDKAFTAPLSKKIITDILKKELGYKGLILTDDIGMSGYKEPSYTQRAVKAILAGNDMVLVSAMENDRVIEVYQGMLRAFQKGELNKKRVNESLRKILKLKSFLLEDKRSLPEKLKSIEKSKKKIYQLSRQINQA